MKNQLIQFLFPCFENNYRPKILEGNFLFYLLFFVITLKIFYFSAYLFSFKTPLLAEILESVLINLTNETRKQQGLPSLKENLILKKAAFLKAKDMLEKEYFAHKSPEGFWTWDLIKELGYSFKIAGENLAIGFLDSKEVINAWLASPLHKRNILNPNFEEIGVAVVRGNFQGNDVYVVVQLFASPREKEEKKQVTSFSQPTPIPPSSLSQPEIKPIKISLPTFAPQMFETQIQNQKENFQMKILKGLTVHFENILSYFILFLLIFLLSILLLTIFVKINIQHPDLIFKTLGVILILGFLFWFTKEKFLYFLPHEVLLY